MVQVDPILTGLRVEATMAASPVFEKARHIARRLLDAGASHCQLVGGCVRDLLLEMPCGDLEIEVYGIGYLKIVEALQGDYCIDRAGRPEGILRVDQGFDVSLPRSKRMARASGKGFDACVDPCLSPDKAAASRDFTINSIAIDLDCRIHDPYGGRQDLERGILRATSSTFGEDPIRVLRAMQFAARFEFTVEPETVELCRRLRSGFSALAVEGVRDEWFKWAAKGVSPAAGLRLLAQVEWLDCFPPLSALRFTPQDPSWHPEGDVWTHTGHVCDAAARIAIREKLDERDRVILLFAALCHDFGKPSTTVLNRSGRWAAPNHAGAGLPFITAFLAGLRAPEWLVEQVLPLVAEHMAHLATPVEQAPSPRQVRRLVDRLAPSSLRLWALLVEADASGRPPLPPRKPAVKWTAAASEISVASSQPAPLVLGRHLLEIGHPPGPRMGELLNRAYEAQLNGTFTTLPQALEWLNRGFDSEK
jgi:tRNA nucleotidyltransferase (CCA-adding enzyme)